MAKIIIFTISILIANSGLTYSYPVQAWRYSKKYSNENAIVMFIIFIVSIAIIFIISKIWSALFDNSTSNKLDTKQVNNNIIDYIAYAY